MQNYFINGLPYQCIEPLVLMIGMGGATSPDIKHNVLFVISSALQLEPNCWLWASPDYNVKALLGTSHSTNKVLLGRKRKAKKCWQEQELLEWCGWLCRQVGTGGDIISVWKYILPDQYWPRFNVGISESHDNFWQHCQSAGQALYWVQRSPTWLERC